MQETQMGPDSLIVVSERRSLSRSDLPKVWGPSPRGGCRVMIGGAQYEKEKKKTLGHC